jgi:endonuclease/exonuclease/phosphatase family metal-dependent hydrolase
MELKLLDLNLWLLPRPLSSDNKKRMDRFIALVKKLDPDIITLQEVWLMGYERYLKKNLKPFHVSSSGKKRLNNSGLVTFSRKKPLSESIHLFKKESLLDKLVRKGYLIIRLNLDGRFIRILNTHLHASLKAKPNKNSIFQFQQLKHVTSEGDWIVAGDLNLRQELFHKLNDGHFIPSRSSIPTYSSKNRYAKARLNRLDHSDRKVDYVLLKLSNGTSYSLSTKVIKSPLMSDHYALFSVIRIGKR